MVRSSTKFQTRSGRPGLGGNLDRCSVTDFQKKRVPPYISPPDTRVVLILASKKGPLIFGSPHMMVDATLPRTFGISD